MIEKFQKVANDCEMEMGLQLEKNFSVGQERGAGVRTNRGWDGVERGERGTWSSKRAGS